MAQKANPIGLRLGLIQVWGTKIQNYNRKNKLYSFFLRKQFLIANYLVEEPIKLKSQILAKNYFTWYYRNLYLNSKYTDFTPGSKQELSRKLDLFLPFTVKMKYFNINKFLLTSDFIASYAEHLFNQNITLKKIISSLVIFLNTQLGLKKVTFLNKGITNVQFIGFKVRISGRFDNSRNQMSKNYVQGFGSLSLICLNNYVEFYNKSIFTKLGVCSFQVWLFYKTIVDDEKKNA
uniref:Ribosomal protein S3 n=1 Tax=Pterocladia lucida TaxID=31408 RepID=A0A6M3WWL7_PTELU|nr:ribosomal protein S3 [Pterocladia lucida]